MKLEINGVKKRRDLGRRGMILLFIFVITGCQFHPAEDDPRYFSYLSPKDLKVAVRGAATSEENSERLFTYYLWFKNDRNKAERVRSSALQAGHKWAINYEQEPAGIYRSHGK